MEFSTGGPVPDWTEEDKARLDLALFGKTDKPLAWVRADGVLIRTKEEADKTEGYRVYPLFAHPLIPEGYKLLKDSTIFERSFQEDAGHENGNYFCTCCDCGRQFQGHKRRVICKVCSQPK